MSSSSLQYLKLLTHHFLILHKMHLPNNSPKQHKSIPTWFAFSISSTFCIFLLLYFNSSIIINTFSSLALFNTNLINIQSLDPLPSPNIDKCNGKYIYIHNLPSRFNIDLLKNCQPIIPWSNICKYLVNSGFGPNLTLSNQTSSLFDGTDWFSTDQFTLEVIFHNRMKHYKCLTNDSTQASAIYVPFYAGLDARRFLWGPDVPRKDDLGIELIEWIRARPEWESMWGKNHFLVLGRISRDFNRIAPDNSTEWGTNLLLLPEAKNITSLAIESNSSHSNEAAIPYPTSFHPSTQNQVIHWQETVTRHKRLYLFSFAGAPRPERPDSIRNQIINQCLNSSSLPQEKKCKLVRCDETPEKCDEPSSLMKLFLSSVFCLQPPGDSYTRRSAFDSILAGCIPVFFHPGSAYNQYLWYLPTNYTKYSVFIDEEGVKRGEVSIQNKLSAIPREQVEAMREEVVRLIPKIVYANPMVKEGYKGFEDAFDIAVTQTLNKIEVFRKEVKEGFKHKNS